MVQHHPLPPLPRYKRHGNDILKGLVSFHLYSMCAQTMYRELKVRYCKGCLNDYFNAKANKEDNSPWTDDGYCLMLRHKGIDKFVNHYGVKIKKLSCYHPDCKNLLPHSPRNMRMYKPKKKGQVSQWQRKWV
jgi:hypothetical protein